MTTVKDLHPYIGKTVLARLEKLLMVSVVIEDCRVVYGRAQFQIRPNNGAGFMWVDMDRVSL